MNYVISDLHGCYDKYTKMLDKIGFSDGDTLYVLGDVTDRGADGIKILLDMMSRPNVYCYLGNHEAMMINLVFDAMAAGEKWRENYTLSNWIVRNGGGSTVKAFMKLGEDKKADVWRYVNNFAIYDEITVGKHTFFISHAGISGYVPRKPIYSYAPQAFISGRMNYDVKLFSNKYVISGHTPTGLIDPKYRGRIYRKNNHIAIDCGAVFGLPLGCVCLDTMDEFYVE